MTIKPFPGIEPFYAHHCVTGSLRRIYEAAGYPISEEMLLGIGAGVGFSYWHFKGTDPFYGGRANFERPGVEGLEKTIGRRTGVGVESFVTSSQRKAEKTLTEMLSEEKPVMLYVDMGFLPYLGLPDDYHFGGHTIAVVGYDAESRSVLVGDRDDGFHEIALDQLEEARASKFRPFPPAHKWFTFDFSEARAPTEVEIRESIGEAASGMLEPPISNIGVKGIRKAARQTVKWPVGMDETALRRTSFGVSIFIDHIGGTGGGIFRYMYGRFLEEAAGISGDTRLSEFAEGFQEVGDRWETVADRFREAAEAPDPAGMLEHAVEPMESIADTEERLWTGLAELAS